MGFNRCLSLPVAIVLFLYSFIIYIVLFLVIEPWLGFWTVHGLLNSIFLAGCAFMGLLAYAGAILREPGSVPAGWVPDTEDGGLIQEVKRKGGDARYCQKCGHYKPPRAHHCRICKRCVLRMDHHCVWINNCVGYHNYKSFFLFVLYVVASCTHALLLMFGQMVDELRDADEDGNSTGGQDTSGDGLAASALLRVTCAIILIPLLLAVGVLLGWHIYLLACNKTTIEHHEGVRARWLAARSGEAYTHPYDLGAVGNAIAVLGPHASLWLCPTARGHLGSGLRFRTCDAAGGDGSGRGDDTPYKEQGLKEQGLMLTKTTRLPC